MGVILGFMARTLIRLYRKFVRRLRRRIGRETMFARMLNSGYASDYVRYYNGE